MCPIRIFGAATTFLVALVVTAFAQGPPPAGPGGPPPIGGPAGPGRRGPPGPPPRGSQSGIPGIALPQGRWWTDPTEVARLGLTADQQKRIDAEFQQDRLKLIDLTAAVEKEEATLEPLLAVERLDEKAVLAQFDRIAEARAELEKANSRMLFGFRSVLTADQWRRLQEDAKRQPGLRGGGPGDRQK
jgi:Spy/CpxP family protein refolding chaperone